MFSFLQLVAVGHIQLLLEIVKLMSQLYVIGEKNSFSLHGMTVRFYSDFEIIELSVKMTFPKKLISLFHS